MVMKTLLGLKVELMMMFKVERLEDGEIFVVYGVRNDKNGYPHFLIYDEMNRSWSWDSAKYYKPYGGV